MRIKGMHCGNCEARVKKALAANGLSAKVELESESALVTGVASVSDRELADTVRAVGFTVREIRPPGEDDGIL